MSELTLPKMQEFSTAEQGGLGRVLALLLKRGETAWLIEDRYEAPTSSWMLGVVRQDAQGRWLRQRYRYDSAVDVLFFLGERPMTEEESGAARRSGKLLRAA